METISVLSLKAHLSAQLKKVQKGTRLTVLDHKRPVAMISPIEKEPLFVKEEGPPYLYRELEPLTGIDPMEKLR